MENTPEREAVIRRMVEIVIEECPWIFNIHSPSYVLRQAWYKNGKSHSISGNYRKYVRIDPEMRRSLPGGREQAQRDGSCSTPPCCCCAISVPAMVITYREKEKVAC